MKRFFFPLFWKFTIAIILVVAVFGSINIYLIWSKVYTSLQKESEKRGLYISRSLAQEAVNPMLYQDYIALQQLIDNIMSIDKSVSYAFIMDDKMNVLVHSFKQGFPTQLRTANRAKSPDLPGIRLIIPVHSNGVIIRDIAMPIMQGKLGTVRVGILEEGIAHDVRATIRVMLLMVGVFLVIGIGGAFLFARFINRPVQEISEVADRLELDSLKRQVQPRVSIREKFLGRWRLPVRAIDELDLLAQKFNDMIARLEDAYAKLQTAQKKLIQSEKMASIGTLSAGIAHEINNPIAGLQNCIRRIARKPSDIKQNQRYLKMMEEAAEKIERVVRGLLDYTRQEEIDFDPVDCREVIEKALLLTAYNLEKSRITITKELPADLPVVSGSANHLQQVMVNLILNSIDAINENCNHNPGCERRIIISAKTDNEWLFISLQDTGVGISPEVKEKIFDPFYTTKPVGYGTGLGLSVCFNIIRTHKGKIEVQSHPGAGTIFTIQLPIYQLQTEDSDVPLKYNHR